MYNFAYSYKPAPYPSYSNPSIKLPQNISDEEKKYHNIIDFLNCYTQTKDSSLINEKIKEDKDGHLQRRKSNSRPLAKDKDSIQ